MRKNGTSIWAFLATVFAAVGLSVAVLPGCGDDTVDHASDSDSDSDYDSFDSQS